MTFGAFRSTQLLNTHCMQKDQNFNPGTGNTFVTVESGGIYNSNPLATTVTNTTNLYMDRSRPSASPLDDTERRIRRNAILNYVAPLKNFVTPEWQGRYEPLWLDILELPEVAAEVYERGQQKDTVFNRNLVGNLIHVLIGRVIGETNVTTLAKALEGKSTGSVRGQMGLKPSASIEKALLRLLA